MVITFKPVAFWQTIYARLRFLKTNCDKCPVHGAVTIPKPFLSEYGGTNSLVPYVIML